MSGLVLLVIGLASLGLVMIMLAYCGLKTWRVSKHGMQVYGDVGPLADQLSDWSVVVEARMQHLTDNGAEIATNVARLRVSVERLQVLAQALSESTAPYRRLRRYLGM